MITIFCHDKIYCNFYRTQHAKYSDLYFRGEEKFTTKDGIVPLEISFLRGKDQGLFKEIKSLKGKVWIDSYIFEQPVVQRDEDGGYMFTRMRSNPKFDASQETRFGRGYRRVEKIYRNGTHIGYEFIPFDDYTDEWASDIHGYDSFEEVLKAVYPLRQREKRSLKEMYMGRPRKLPGSSMVLTPWQERVIEILDLPIDYDAQEREFYWFADFVGKVGKSMLVKHIQATREDTLVISSTGKMSDLVCSVKEPLLSNSKIKNIVLDFPRDIPLERLADVDFEIMDDAKHNGDTLKFMESCVNGRFTSLKYVSDNFPIEHGLRVIVFANSVPLITATSLDRWRINVIKDMNSLFIKDLRYDDSLPRITTRSKVIDFYLSSPQFVEYLRSIGLNGRIPRIGPPHRID